MSSLLFHNNTVSINDMWYESHAALLRALCVELDAVDKVPELTEKLLGKKLKMKAHKNPNKPKRPKSAYFFFCDEKRPALIKSQKDKGQKVNIGEIAKELSGEWAKLTAAQKKKYEKLNEKAKEEYETAMQNFEESY